MNDIDPLKTIAYTILLIAFAGLGANAQDSLARVVQKKDSAIKFSDHKVDSVHKQFVHQTDNLQKAYAAPMKELHTAIGRLNHKKDSLNRLHLPTNSLTHKIDSLEKAQARKLNELNGKIQKVKQETLSGISSLHLPPQAQTEINALTKNIKNFSVPSNFFQLPGMSLKIPGIANTSMLSLPTNLSIPNANIPSLQRLSFNQLPALSKLQGSLGVVKQLQSTSNLESIEKTITSQLAQTAEAKSLLQQTSQVTMVEKKLSSLKNSKNPDSLARQELKPALNHFIGKDKELQSAMSQISKYKQKYTSLQGLDKIPKRVPNPLKSKPWTERLVPGLNYFIQSKTYVMVDFNPYIGWKFNPKLTASIGWNERIGISKGSIHTNMYDRVYGVRGSVSYSWTHGFIFRLSPEAMMAYVPTVNSTDIKQQAMVYGLFGGVRRDFKLYKNLIGYSEGVYNFIQKPGRNIYGDQVSFRMGIELKLKKKGKSNLAMVNPSTLRRRALKMKDTINIVRKEKFFAVLTVKGDTLVPLKYQRIKKFVSDDGKLYFIVKKDKKYGALYSSGKEFIPISHLESVLVKLEIIDRVRKQFNLDRMVK